MVNRLQSTTRNFESCACRALERGCFHRERLVRGVRAPLCWSRAAFALPCSPVCAQCRVANVVKCTMLHPAWLGDGIGCHTECFFVCKNFFVSITSASSPSQCACRPPCPASPLSGSSQPHHVFFFNLSGVVHCASSWQRWLLLVSRVERWSSVVHPSSRTFLLFHAPDGQLARSTSRCRSARDCLSSSHVDP